MAEFRLGAAALKVLVFRGADGQPGRAVKVVYLPTGAAYVGETGETPLLNRRQAIVACAQHLADGAHPPVLAVFDRVVTKGQEPPQAGTVVEMVWAGPA